MPSAKLSQLISGIHKETKLFMCHVYLLSVVILLEFLLHQMQITKSSFQSFWQVLGLNLDYLTYKNQCSIPLFMIHVKMLNFIFLSFYNQFLITIIVH